MPAKSKIIPIISLGIRNLAVSPRHRVKQIISHMKPMNAEVFTPNLLTKIG
jgi:hypothetical protein